MDYDQHIDDWLAVCSQRTFRTYMDKCYADENANNPNHIPF